MTITANVEAPSAAVRPVSAPQRPHSRILKAGSFVSAHVHKIGDTVEERIERAYSEKIASTNRCQEPTPVNSSALQAAKVVYKTSHVVSKVAGGAAHMMDDLAERVGAKVAKKGSEDSVAGRCLLAYNEVRDAVGDRAESAVSRVASCHLEYQEHKDGPEAAELVRYIGGSAKNITSGYFSAQKLANPTKGLAKGIVKNAVKKHVLGVQN